MFNYVCGNRLCGNKILMHKKGEYNTIHTAVKGFTLIEVLCSIAVFSLLFMTALYIQINAVKIKNYNEDADRYTLIMEYIKNNVRCNFSYEDILNLHEEGRVYLDCRNLKSEDIEKVKLYGLFSSVKPSREPYIILNIAAGEVLKIDLQFYGKIYGDVKVDKYEFYRGNY